MSASNRRLFIIILFMACLGQMASDIYVPSVPAISYALHSTIPMVQWSIAAYLFAMATSQLVYGPLSEGWGRRLPVIIGLSIMMLGSIVAIFSTSVEMLIISRLIQGAGVGACTSLWRSIFRDVYQGDELAKYGGYLAIFVTFFIPTAPLLGGYLQVWFGWQASFVFIALYALFILLIVMTGLRETSQHHHKDRLKRKFITSTFGQLLKSRLFMGYTLCVLLTYGAFFAWFAVGPVLLIHNLKMSPSLFGWITFVASGLAIAAAGRFNGVFITRLGMNNMLRLGWSLMFIAGAVMLLGNLIFGVNIIAVIIPLTIFYFGCTLIWPSAFSGAVSPFGKIAGYTGALYSFMQLSGGALMTFLVSYLPHTTQRPLAWVFMISPVAAFLVFNFMVLPAQRRLQAESG